MRVQFISHIRAERNLVFFLFRISVNICTPAMKINNVPSFAYVFCDISLFVRGTKSVASLLIRLYNFHIFIYFCELAADLLRGVSLGVALRIIFS